MTQRAHAVSPFNIAIVGQAGRLGFEAILFAASLRHQSPKFTGSLLIAEPQPSPLWPKDPRMSDAVRNTLTDLGATIVPFENKVFGAAYPHGNKIEMLRTLPPETPFVFFDSDTLITGDITTVPFDFERPSASLRRTGTWPTPALYGPGHGQIWRALYERFDLDFASSRDMRYAEDDWRLYLYFNASFFYDRCPVEFGRLFEHYAQSIWHAPPEALACQSLDPWLDQIALPLAVHALGGGRDALPQGYLDDCISCHYRLLPLLYAREADHVIETLETVAAPHKIKKVLKLSEPIKRMVYQQRGAKVRALFAGAPLPKREQVLRNRIKSAGFWMR